MGDRRIAPGLWVLDGAVQTGVLVHDGRALLFDCCDSVTPERLARLGVTSVDMILCTQHRRPNVAGAYAFVEKGAQLLVPAGARALFEGVAAYWEDPANRWHIYHHQPGPQVLARPLPVAREVHDGERIDWHGHEIEVLATPGATDHSVSYLVSVDGQRVCFSGDALYGPGQLWEIDALQKGFGCLIEYRDYHGYIGNALKLIPSLRKLAACGADVLVPSHGALDRAACRGDRRCWSRGWRRCGATRRPSRHSTTTFRRCTTTSRTTRRAWLRQRRASRRRLCGASPIPAMRLSSDAGALLLIDCGHQSVIDTLQAWLAEGKITSVDGCWVTHYHDDHVDALAALQAAFGCPVMTDQHLVEILEHPERFFLPCISPTVARDVRATREGETWRWHEFTPHRLPLSRPDLLSQRPAGRGSRHLGLFCRGFRVTHGHRRPLLPQPLLLWRIGRGFRRCIEIWRRTQPEFILNEHQERAFRLSPEQLDYMEHMLAEREKLLSTMLPWAHPDFGCDEGWVRAYPYEQTVQPGRCFPLDVQFTNHGPAEAVASVEPVLPAGWTWNADAAAASCTVPARSAGCVGAYVDRPDGVVHLGLSAPTNATPGLYVVPLRVTWDGRYLGQFRHALVRVGASEA